MKNKFIVLSVLGAFLASSLSASWVIVNSDGSTERLDSCCPKKVVKKRVVKRVVKEPEVCETCDYSKFEEAVLLPVGDEKLEPAKLRDCD